jgi:hypothetical protein
MRKGNISKVRFAAMFYRVMKFKHSSLFSFKEEEFPDIVTSSCSNLSDELPVLLAQEIDGWSSKPAPL